MLLGIDSYSYQFAFAWGGMDVFAFIQRAHALGLDGVKINMGENYGYHLGDADPGRLAEIRQLAQSLGLYLELDTRGTAPAHLERSLRICHALGGDVLRTYVSFGGPLEEQLARAPHDLRAVLPLCADLGIRIALENHEYETAAQMVALINAIDSPHVGLQVDTGNSMPIWEDPLEAVRTMAPRAVSTHFKDQIIIRDADGPRSVGTPLGYGNIDLAACFQTLVDHSPLRRINLQVCYGYSSPFRLPESEGHGGRLGMGAFAVKTPPADAWWQEPHPMTRPPDMRAELVQRQERAVAESLAVLRQLNAGPARDEPERPTPKC